VVFVGDGMRRGDHGVLWESIDPKAIEMVVCDTNI
jgi:hypothetical protein